MCMNNVKNLSEAISYQSGKITHIPLLTSKAGAIVLMAFDKETALAEHFTPCEAAVQVIDGELKFTVEGKAHILKAGDFLTMTPGQRHSVEAIEPTKMLLTKMNVLPGNE